MRRLSLFPLLLLLIGGLMPPEAGAQSEQIRYTVSMPEPWTHYYQVRMDVGGVEGEVVDFQLPSWTPGSYLMREFPQNVEAFSARGGGGRLPSRKVDKNTWRVERGGASSITASYQVYANNLSVRTSGLDETYGFIAPADVLMYIEGREYEPHLVTLEPYGSWESFAPLPRSAQHSYRAPDYDWVVDSPITMGELDILEFEVLGTPHRFVFNRLGGPVYYDLEEADRLVEDTRAVIEAGAAIFGGLPYPEYSFMVLVGAGGGGIEHLNCTSLSASRFVGSHNDFRGMMGLIAHEWFHAWNVKRLHPEALGPFDYTEENYTTQLWVMEGIDSYYTDLLQYRARLTDREGLLAALARNIQSMETTPGAEVQSPAEASIDAWVKAYRSNENAPNRQFSYYTSGEVLGLLLDLRIRDLTDGERGLDHVQRLLWERYGSKAPKGKGWPEEGYREAVEEVAGSDLSGFFASYVHGTEPIPYQGFFQPLGLRLEVTSEPVLVDGRPAAELGAGLDSAEGGYPRVRRLLRGSNGWEERLQYDDIIVGVDGLVARDGVLERVIANKRPGDTLRLTILRGQRMVEQQVRLGTRTSTRYSIRRLPDPTDRQQRLLEGWLER